MLKSLWWGSHSFSQRKGKIWVEAGAGAQSSRPLPGVINYASGGDCRTRLPLFFTQTALSAGRLQAGARYSAALLSCWSCCPPFLCPLSWTPHHHRPPCRSSQPSVPIQGCRCTTAQKAGTRQPQDSSALLRSDEMGPHQESPGRPRECTQTVCSSVHLPHMSARSLLCAMPCARFWGI